MKKIGLSIIISFLIILLGSTSVFGFSYIKSSATVKIVSVKDLSVSIIQNSKYTLPNTVKAVLTNKKIVDMPVAWKPNTVKTDAVGSFIYKGRVKSYSKNIILKLTINTPPITITQIERLLPIEVKQNDACLLPSSVIAAMSNGTKENYSVIWTTSPDTSIIGIETLDGKINGYNTLVKLNIVVRGRDLEVPEKIYSTEPQVGDIVGTTSALSAIKYDHFGVYIGNGEVIEYSSPTGKMSDGEVLENPLDLHFKPDKRFVYKLKDVKFTPEEIVENAKSRLGEKKYSLISNNCENFAVWCQTGISKSFQIDNLSVRELEALDAILNNPTLRSLLKID